MKLSRPQHTKETPSSAESTSPEVSAPEVPSAEISTQAPSPEIPVPENPTTSSLGSLPKPADSKSNAYLVSLAVILLLIIIITQFFEINLTVKRRPLLNRILASISHTLHLKTNWGVTSGGAPDRNSVEGINPEEIFSKEGASLGVVWKGYGIPLTELGVIDKKKFEDLYRQRGEITQDTSELLSGSSERRLVINEENAGVLLNLLWAFGLANKNEILEKGPMTDKKYGGAGRFASTGGWTLSRGDAMQHYSMHRIITLTKKQQELVERVAKNIYRPCCNNSTYFPDCNHGMAMLGLLELGASQGLSEEQLYRTALAAQAYWFPDTYLTIAAYLKNIGKSWKEVSPQEILSYNFSSGSGFRAIQSQVPAQGQRGGSCGV